MPGQTERRKDRQTGGPINMNVFSVPGLFAYLKGNRETSGLFDSLAESFVIVYSDQVQG